MERQAKRYHIKRYHIEPADYADDNADATSDSGRPLWPMLTLMVIPFILTLGGAYICSLWGAH